MSWYITVGLWVLLIVGGLVLGRLQARWERSVYIANHPDEKPPGEPVWFPEHVHIDNAGSYQIITAEGNQKGAPQKLKPREINANQLIWVDVNGDFEKMRIRSISVGIRDPWIWQAESEASLQRRYSVEEA